MSCDDGPVPGMFVIPPKCLRFMRLNEVSDVGPAVELYVNVVLN